MEHKIGETIIFDGNRKAIVIRHPHIGPTCGKCVFDLMSIVQCIAIKCCSFQRSDMTDVIYEEIPNFLND